MKKPKNARTAKKDHKTKSAAGDVRIIGGQFKRRIVSFIDADGLRPTPDRLRETLFNWLLADIHGAYVPVIVHPVFYEASLLVVGTEGSSLYLPLNKSGCLYQ